MRVVILLAVAFTAVFAAPAVNKLQPTVTVQVKVVAPLVTKDELLAQAQTSLEAARAALATANAALQANLDGTAAAEEVLSIVARAEAQSTLITGQALLECQRVELEPCAAVLTEALGQVQALATGAIEDVLVAVAAAGIDTAPIVAIGEQLSTDLTAAIAPLVELIGQVGSPAKAVILVTKDELLAQAQTSLEAARAALATANAALQANLDGTAAAEEVLSIVARAEAQSTLITGQALLECQRVELEPCAAVLTEALGQVQALATGAIEDVLVAVAAAGIDTAPIFAIGEQLSTDLTAAIAPLVELIGQVGSPAKAVILVTKDELLAQAEASLGAAGSALRKANDALVAALANTAVVGDVESIVVRAEAEAALIAGSALFEGQRLPVEELAVLLAETLARVQVVAEKAVADVLVAVTNAGLDVSAVQVIVVELQADLSAAIAPLLELIAQVPAPARH